MSFQEDFDDEPHWQHSAVDVHMEPLEPPESPMPPPDSVEARQREGNERLSLKMKQIAGELMKLNRAVQSIDRLVLNGVCVCVCANAPPCTAGEGHRRDAAQHYRAHGGREDCVVVVG